MGRLLTFKVAWVTTPSLTTTDELSGYQQGDHYGHCPAKCGPFDLRPAPLMVRLFREEEIMSIARITEISSTSEKSFEDAIQSAVTRATQTLRNVRGAWVKEQQIKIDNGRIIEYQVNLMITFVLEDGDQTDVA